MPSELRIEAATANDAGELMTVQRAAFVAEGETYGTFRLPPMTETRALAGRVSRFELFTGSTSEGTLRLYRSLGYVDLGLRPASQITPPLAYLEKRV